MDELHARPFSCPRLPRYVLNVETPHDTPRRRAAARLSRPPRPRPAAAVGECVNMSLLRGSRDGTDRATRIK